MIANKREFGLGMLLFLGFWIVFFVGMSPVFKGQNILDYLDNLYNSISKNSAYYIPAAAKKLEPFQGRQVSFTINVNSEDQAKRYTALLAHTAEVGRAGGGLTVNGDVASILGNMLIDADSMFANNGASLAEKYGFGERQALFDTWTLAGGAAKDLEKQKRFNEAKIFQYIQTKALEPAYNYYGIEAEDIRSKLGTVVASLIGYVVYTLWFGFAIMFMFEGWGLRLTH